MLTINKMNFITSAQLNPNKNAAPAKTHNSLQKSAVSDSVSFSGKKSAKQVVALSHELANKICLLDIYFAKGENEKLEEAAREVFEHPIEAFVGMDGARGLYNSGMMLARSIGMKGLNGKGEIIDPEHAASSLALMMETSKKMLRATQVNKKPDVQEYLLSKSSEIDHNRCMLFSIVNSKNNNLEFMDLYVQKLDDIEARHPSLV